MRYLILLCCLLSGLAHAVGPKVMATLERTQLQEPPLTSHHAYNTASRHEILAFAQALLHSETLDSEHLRQRLGIKKINSRTVEQVRQAYWQRLLAGYGYASQTCSDCQPADSLTALRALAAQEQVAPLRAQFHQHYLDEQLRLAALFPAISSEIATFSPQEITGAQWRDSHFLLTFDDGPTAVDGNTDRLLERLRQYPINGIFFVLGEKVQQRLQRQSAHQLAALYQGQCIGAHGWQHKSHSSWGEWQRSILDTVQLIQQVAPQSYVPFFRPPYGQRKADSAPFFQQQGLQVMLWNIDSQDWSQQLSAQQTADRVLTLMLLWRQGIILFHDTHNKALTAIETLQQAAGASGLKWLDCHTVFSAE